MPVRGKVRGEHRLDDEVTLLELAARRLVVVVVIVVIVVIVVVVVVIVVSSCWAPSSARSRFGTAAAARRFFFCDAGLFGGTPKPPPPPPSAVAVAGDAAAASERHRDQVLRRTANAATAPTAPSATDFRGLLRASANRLHRSSGDPFARRARGAMGARLLRGRRAERRDGFGTRATHLARGRDALEDRGYAGSAGQSVASPRWIS